MHEDTSTDSLLRDLSGTIGAGADVDATRERVLDAALARFEDFGIRRTTMEDVARGAGVSRVTIYRRFPQKERLVEAVIMREGERFFAELERAVGAKPELEERIVEGFAFTLASAREHVLLTRLIRTEEGTLPYLTTAGGPVIAAAREFLARQMPRGRDSEAVAEIVARLVLSFLLTPESSVALDSPRQARAFARRYVAPLMTRGTLEG